MTLYWFLKLLAVVGIGYIVWIVVDITRALFRPKPPLDYSPREPEGQRWVETYHGRWDKIPPLRGDRNSAWWAYYYAHFHDFSGSSSDTENRPRPS